MDAYSLKPLLGLLCSSTVHSLTPQEVPAVPDSSPLKCSKVPSKHNLSWLCSLFSPSPSSPSVPSLDVGEETTIGQLFFVILLPVSPQSLGAVPGWGRVVWNTLERWGRCKLRVTQKEYQKYSFCEIDEEEGQLTCEQTGVKLGRKRVGNVVVGEQGTVYTCCSGVRKM